MQLKKQVTSSQTSRPGIVLKKSVSNSKFSPKFSSPIKSPNPSTTGFNLQEVVKNFKAKKSTVPFKLIKFEDSKHTRQKTTIIKNTDQTYMFAELPKVCTNKSNLEEPKEEKSKIEKDSYKQNFNEICNNTVDSLKNQMESLDSLDYAMVPNKYWCQKCNAQVISQVKFTFFKESL